MSKHLLGVQAAYNRWQRAKSEWYAARETFDAALRRAYENGLTMQGLARMLDVSYPVVREALLRAGSDIRRRGRRKEGGDGKDGN